jgi:hypothetical protein
MPKVASQKRMPKHAIYAKDYINGGIVRMNETFSHTFDNVGKPTRTKITFYPPVVPREIPREEQIRFLLEAERDALEKSLLNRLLIQKRKLEDRISNPLPLLKRLSEPGPSRPLYEPPAPIPDTLHFVQTKKLKRLEDLKIVLNTVRERLDPIFELLKEDEDKEKLEGTTPRVSEDIRDELWSWYNEVQEIDLRESKEWRKYTNKQWRFLFGSLKQLKKININNPKERLPNICTELHSLHINIPKVE